MNAFKCISILLLSILLVGCDALNVLSYSIQNRTKQTVKISVPNYSTQVYRPSFARQVDTILVIEPGETIWIGVSEVDIDFPWATKKIYHQQPGRCGLQLLRADSVLNLDCTKSSWKYKRGTSILKLKPLMLNL
jgi:hypothetical protein